MKLRVLIADDELLARERLRQLLKAVSMIEIVAECSTGQEALEAIVQKQPDVVFLDVKMPDLDGFGVIQRLSGSRLPVIIFVTAHDHFALQAFETNAADYLLKPFDRERFQMALRRACDRMQLDLQWRNGKSQAEASSAMRASTQPLERLTVKLGSKIIFVKVVDIDWISAADNYAELHVGDKRHFLRTSITALANRLPENRFTRISRSLLVNLDHVKEIRSKSHGDYWVHLHNGTRLAGSRNYRHRLEELLSISR